MTVIGRALPTLTDHSSIIRGSTGVSGNGVAMRTGEQVCLRTITLDITHSGRPGVITECTTRYSNSTCVCVRVCVCVRAFQYVSVCVSVGQCVHMCEFGTKLRTKSNFAGLNDTIKGATTDSLNFIPRLLSDTLHDKFIFTTDRR